MPKTSKIGRHGTVVIPARLRRRFGLEEGRLVIIEEADDGVRIRPAMALPVEVYSAERKAEFLLNNATGAADYKRAARAVKKMGLDPAAVPRKKP